MSIPPPLEALVLRLLAKAPDERPESATVFREELLAAVREGQGTPRTGRGRAEAAIPLNRDARADAMGIRQPPGPTQLERPNLPREAPVIVVESAPQAAASCTTLLRANELNVLDVGDLDDAQVQIVRLRPGAVVMVLTLEPEIRLNALEERLVNGSLVGCPVVLVGPSDSMDLMTRALGLGIAQYVPHSVAPEKLPKVVRRLLRRRLRQLSRDMSQQ